MRIKIRPVSGSENLYDVWLAFDAGRRKLPLVDRLELKELAEALNQHELELQERERQRSKNP